MSPNPSRPAGAIHETGPPDDEAPAVGSVGAVGEPMVPLSVITDYLLQEDALLRLRAKRVRREGLGPLDDPADAVGRGVELAEIAGQMTQIRRHVSRLAAKTGVEIVPIDEEEDEK